MPNKIAFRKIKTVDELKTRLECGVLSVGCHFDSIKKYLHDTKTKEHPIEITVRYASFYGWKKKIYYI